MACFTAVAVEAVAATVVKKHIRKKEQAALAAGLPTAESRGKISWSRKLSWLTNLLWGGVFLLIVEHMWHGEVVPWFPFLTAIGDPADTLAMLREIAAVGTAMCLVVTGVWYLATVVADAVVSRSAGTDTVR